VEHAGAIARVPSRHFAPAASNSLRPSATLSGVNRPPLNFAVIGAAGYVGVKHLEAITSLGHRVVAACDTADSAGVLDRFSLDTAYFHRTDELAAFVRARAGGGDRDRVHVVVVCSPNDLHAEHVRLGLYAGADVICEKPTVLAPADLDALKADEKTTGRRVYGVLQLRYQPDLLALRAQLAAAPPARVHDVVLSYVTPRGPWYDASWKGAEARSGGLVVNIGIHLFDLLTWCFGRVTRLEVDCREARRAFGTIEFSRARVRWFLSTRPADASPPTADGPARRTIVVDGRPVEFSKGAGSLHRRVYEEVLAGRGLGLEECRPSIEIVDAIRRAVPTGTAGALTALAAAGLV
jgi:UDP-N-acetyl-2-amino-2-deoxyglucuronate dehydrogenase